MLSGFVNAKAHDEATNTLDDDMSQEGPIEELGDTLF